MSGRGSGSRSEFRFGLETLLDQPSGVHFYAAGSAEGAQRATEGEVAELVKRVTGKRIALLAHPASVDGELNHSVERLLPWCESAGGRLSALLGPQHGLRGEKQDNMVESDHYTDPDTGLPVFSLYGETRRLTESM
ncbi:MAG TPA: exo-beta-N-acetylmuramidase NamZ domain-containing protein, partial [Spirochaetia bacterium]|nr:exo-beta-N-acetylmuramidase NamZ domain-containing protein [Spirochaetia bacterium]